MQIDVEYAKAFERACIASHAPRPLIELTPGEPEPTVTVETSTPCGADPSRDAVLERLDEDAAILATPVIALHEQLPLRPLQSLLAIRAIGHAGPPS